MMNKNIKLYHHKTDGGAEYLFDTYITCESGHKEGAITDDTKYIVRIDGDITKDAEMTIRNNDPFNTALVCVKTDCEELQTEDGEYCPKHFKN